MAIKESLELASRTITAPFPASTAIAVGDLLWSNSGVAAKASAIADLGSLALNQADFRPKFLGVAGDQRLASETSTGNDSRRLVITEGIFDCDCDSATFEIGDPIGIARSATPLNENQKVVGVTSFELAIGFVVKREPSAVTKVRCLLSSIRFGVFNKASSHFFQGQGVIAASDADTTLTVAQIGAASSATMTPTAARKLILPAVAQSAGLRLLVSNLAAATHAINVRNPGDSATVVSIPATKSGMVWCDGSAWYGLAGA